MIEEVVAVISRDEEQHGQPVALHRARDKRRGTGRSVSQDLRLHLTHVAWKENHVMSRPERPPRTGVNPFAGGTGGLASLGSSRNTPNSRDETQRHSLLSTLLNFSSLCLVCMTTTAIRRISSTLRHLSPAPSFASLKMSNEYQTRIIGVSGAVRVLARFAGAVWWGTCAAKVQWTREGGLGCELSFLCEPSLSLGETVVMPKLSARGLSPVLA